MTHIPIDLPDQAVHIHAQRELAFEVISSFGGTGNGMQGGSASGAMNHKPGSVVLAEDGSRMLVEFNTLVKVGPFAATWKTTEWVSPDKPESIGFELVPDRGIIAGGLRQLTDHFDFEKQGDCMLLTYRSRFGIRWSFAGWLLGKVVISPIIKKHMVEHLVEVKAVIENRARRSRVYPQRECSEPDDVRGGD